MTKVHNSFLRKIMAGVAGVALTFASITGVSAESLDQEISIYTDLQEKPSNIKQEYFDEIVEAVEVLSFVEILNGYPDGTFRPMNAVTREEAAKIIANTLDLEVEAGTSSGFSDVKGSWAESEGYLAAIKEAGIMTGDAGTDGKPNGKFRPKAKITRAEIAATIVRAFELEEEEDFTSTFADIDKLAKWAKDAITTLEANGYANGIGDHKFGPAQNIKRGDTAIFLYRILIDFAFQFEVDYVIDQIAALDANAESFEADVQAAREAYDALSEEQQALVTNIADLEIAELMVAVTIKEVDGNAVLSTTQTVTGLSTVITLVDAENNPVKFGDLFKTLTLTTTVGKGTADVNDLYDLVKNLDTITYGPEGGYTLTAGEDQVTKLVADLNEDAAAGTYTLTTKVIKGDIILEVFNSNIEVAEKATN